MVNERFVGNEEESCKRENVFVECASQNVFNSPECDFVSSDNLVVATRSTVNRDSILPTKIKSVGEERTSVSENNESRDKTNQIDSAINNLSVLENQIENLLEPKFSASLISVESNATAHHENKLSNTERIVTINKININELESECESPSTELSSNKNVESTMSGVMKIQSSRDSSSGSITSSSFDDSRLRVSGNSHCFTSNGSEIESISTIWPSLVQSSGTFTPVPAESFLSSLKSVSESIMNESSSMDAGIMIWGLNNPNNKLQIYSMNSSDNAHTMRTSLSKKSSNTRKNTQNSATPLVWIGGLRKVNDDISNNTEQLQSPAEKLYATEMSNSKGIKSVLYDKILCKRCCPPDCFEAFKNVYKRLRKI